MINEKYCCIHFEEYIDNKWEYKQEFCLLSEVERAVEELFEGCGYAQIEQFYSNTFMVRNVKVYTVEIASSPYRVYTEDEANELQKIGRTQAINEMTKEIGELQNRIDTLKQSIEKAAGE